MSALLSSRKAELEFIEVIMVLVVVVVLLVLGLIVYYNVSSKGIEEVGRRISDTQASVLVNVISSLPEVQCSVRGSPKDCVDVLKLVSFNYSAGMNKAGYSELLGYKVVRFEQVYPVPIRGVGSGECSPAAVMDLAFPSNCGNWTVYSNPKPGFVSRDVVKTPVSLFNPLAKSYSVGILFVEVYS